MLLGTPDPLEGMEDLVPMEGLVEFGIDFGFLQESYSKCMTKYRSYRKPETPYDSEASRGAGSSRSIDFEIL